MNAVDAEAGANGFRDRKDAAVGGLGELALEVLDVCFP